MLSSMVLAALAPFTLALPSAGLPARASNLGNWDISTVAAGIPSGGYQRNLTSIYTYNGASESIWLITHCIRQGGPGFEEVDFCDNPDFSWTVEGEAGECFRSIVGSRKRGRAADKT